MSNHVNSLITEIDVSNPPKRKIFVGHIGETGFRKIVFLVDSWKEEFPTGTPTLVFKRADGKTYPVNLSQNDDGNPIFTPSSTETAFAGDCVIQLRWTQNEVLGKTCNLPANVESAIGSVGPLPDDDVRDYEAEISANTNARHTHSNKNILDGITAQKVSKWDEGEANVQPDFNQNNTSKPDYIKNKPPQLPFVSGTDNGKVLGVINGSWQKTDPPDSLPSVNNNDNGMVLGVTGGAWNKIDAPDSLPSTNLSDKGKVLAVDSNGEWVAGTPEFVTGTDTQVATAVNNYLDTEGVPSLQPEAADSVADAVIGAPWFEEQIQEAVNAYMDSSEQISPIETVHIGSRNLLNPNTLTVGYIIPSTGNIQNNTDAQGHRTSDYIAVEPGQVIRGCYLDPNDNDAQKELYIRFIAVYDANKVLMPNDGSAANTKTFAIPNGAAFVRLSYARERNDGSLLYGDNVMIETRTDGWSEYEPYIGGESYYLRSEINVRAAQIDGLDASIEDYLDEHPASIPVSSVNGKTGAVELDGEDVGVVESEPASKNLLNPNTLSVGYINPPTGRLQPHDAEGYRTSDYIAVEPGQVIRGCYLDPNDNNVQKNLPIRFITTFDSEKGLLPNDGMTTKSQTFVIPSGVGYVRLSYARERNDGSLLYGDNVMIETRTDGWSEYEAYSDEKNKTLASDITVRAEQIEGLPDDQDSIFDRGLRYVFDLGSSGFDSGAKVLDIADYSMAFRGTVGGSFGGVTIAHGYQTYMGGWVTVTDTNVSVYTGDTGAVRLNAAHGLTIKDYLFVLIEAGHDDKARVVVGTNGGVFEQDGVTWSVRNGNLTVAPVGNTTMADCVLSYWCDKWDASTHIYGDSYLSATSPARWSHYLYEDGYTDFLLNGYPGCNAQNAIVAARIVLAHSQPKRIVWAIGMNNNDANNTLNAAWKSATDELIALCDERGIDLILATIPNVATVNNAQKNAFVEASGLRYVDFAEAVGAKNDTTWYDGMLSTDGVHPAAPGALALYRQALSDVPELMTKCSEAQSAPSEENAVLEEIVTITGDGTRPMISTDKNGNPFALKKVVVKMTLGADASAAGNISVQCRPSASVVKNLASLYFPWSASAKAAWTGMGIVEQDAGYWKQHNWGFAAGGYSQIYGSATYCYADAVSDYPAIGAIYFGSAIPTGMEIKVFGVENKEDTP